MYKLNKGWILIGLFRVIVASQEPILHYPAMDKPYLLTSFYMRYGYQLALYHWASMGLATTDADSFYRHSKM